MSSALFNKFEKAGRWKGHPFQFSISPSWKKRQR